MLVGRIIVTTFIVALLVMTTIPVDAAPSMQTGNRSVYNLSASISSLQTCATLVQGGAIGCPLMGVCNPAVSTCGMSTNINGTIGWTIADLSSTTASLNVTRDLTISSDNSIRPVIQSAGSFNESINLATRLVSLFPTIMPEMDQLLQTAQTTAGTGLTGVNLTASMSNLETMIPNHQFYTMWWVNGPLTLNQTIPVLVLPTNVTGTSNVDLRGSLGSREAWTLMFNFTRAMNDPIPATTSNSLISDNFQVGFVFNYDKTSDLLLSATAEIHSGFQNEITFPPPTCVPSASMACPVTLGPTTIMQDFGVNIEASLKLSSTTIDLSHRMTETPPSSNNGGTQSSGGSNNGNGSGGSNGSGSGAGSNGSGSGASGNNGATGSTGQSLNNSNQPGFGIQLSNWPSWIYALLGILIAAVIGSAVWIAKRRSRNLTSPPLAQGPG